MIEDWHWLARLRSAEQLSLQVVRAVGFSIPQ
jgi:hypothetical protein